MQSNHKLNHSLFILALMILLFVAVCPLVQAQTSPNDIAFDRRSANFNNSEIFTMKADGSNQINLTNGAAFEARPDWSPDGSRIVFSRAIGIWIMNADGSNRIQLTNVGSDTLPNWSPDGSKIAFIRFDGGNAYDIYVMNADGSNQVKLTAAVGREFNSAPRWSPDGTKIVFHSDKSSGGGDNEIYVMNADGTNQINLTNNNTQDFFPDWSPDGSKIVFHTNRDSGNFEIYVMNANGSSQTRITNNPALDALPSWSPDGTKLAFSSNRDGNDEIYTMNADGSNQLRLTNNTVSDIAPRWKPSRAAAVARRVILNDYFGTGRSDYVLPNVDEDGRTHFDILKNSVEQPAQIRNAYFGRYNSQTARHYRLSL